MLTCISIWSREVDCIVYFIFSRSTWIREIWLDSNWVDLSDNNQIGKQKGLIIILNQGRKISYPIGIFGIITHAIFLTENFKEVIQKVTHNKIILSQEIKNLQIITVIMLEIMNVRNRKNVGNASTSLCISMS